MPKHRIETHAHTSLVSPCGKLPPDELVRRYLEADYSALVITDHLTHWVPLFEGAETWAEKARRFFSGYRAARTAAADTRRVIYPVRSATIASVCERRSSGAISTCSPRAPALT